MHKDKKSNIKAFWRSTAEYERKWKDNANTDQELATGGVHLRFKSKMPVPEMASLVYRHEQIILQGYVTYTMLLKYTMLFKYVTLPAVGGGFNLFP